MTRRLRCPRCRGRLRVAPGLLRCATCGSFPILGGVPVLVPDPAGWCASFREAALAALAEHGLAAPETVARIDAFAAAAPSAEPSQFGDDWTRHELEGTAPPQPVEGPASGALEALFEACDASSPSSWLFQRVPARSTVLELGCGAGVLSERLARVTQRLVVADLSLRAVLTSRARAAAPLGVVADAEHLPFADLSFDVLIAENVVDLLEAPNRFFEGAARVAAQMLLSMPQLLLGEPALLRDAGLEVRERASGVPWLRRIDPRHLELYLVELRALAPRERRLTSRKRRA